MRRTHGESNSAANTPEYRAWSSIKRRCYNAKATDYHRYGGRGIIVCDRWVNSFENFLADMGRRPSLVHSIDRIDVNGIYSPDNCRWATPEQQRLNTRVNHRLELNGEVRTVSEWQQLMGLPKDLIYQRVNKLKWTAHKAITTPLQHTHYRRAQ